MDGDLNETTPNNYRAPVYNWHSTEDSTSVYEAMTDTATFDVDRTMGTTYSPEMYPSWNIVRQQKQQHEFETSAAMAAQQSQDKQNDRHTYLDTQQTYSVLRRTRQRENRRRRRQQIFSDSSQPFTAHSSEADLWSMEIPTESTSHVPHVQWRESFEISPPYNSTLVQEDNIPVESSQSSSPNALKSQYLDVIVYSDPAGDLTRGRSDRLHSKLGDLAETYASQCLGNIAIAFSGNPTFSKGVGLHLYCENGKTIRWLESTIASIEPLWDGGKLYIKKWEHRAKFVKARLDIPVCSKDITVVTQALRGFNPQYKVQNWEICSYERTKTNPEEAGCLLVLNIPEDTVVRDILPNQRKVNYRMGPCYLKFLTPKGKLVNEYPAIDAVDTSLMVNVGNSLARQSCHDSSMFITNRSQAVLSNTEIPDTYMPTNENIIKSEPKNTDDDGKKLLEELTPEQPKTRKYDWPWPPPVDSSPIYSGSRKRERDRGDHRRRYEDNRSDTRHKEDRRHRHEPSSQRPDRKESKWREKDENPPSGYEDPAMSFPKPDFWVCELDKQRQWVRHLFNRMRNTKHEVDITNYKNALAEYKKTLRREKAKVQRKGRY